MTTPEIICHRGLHDTAIENSLESFSLAARLGTDGIETDVRLTRDGRLVLYHDRATPSGQATKDVTFAELSAALGYEPPSLDEALSAWPEFHWMIEIKHPNAVPATLEVVTKYHGIRNMTLIGFWHPTMIAAARTFDVPVGITFCHRPASFGDLAESIKTFCPRIRTAVISYEFADDDLIHEMRECGWQAYIYDAQTEAEHQQCIDWCVRGIITDHPQRLRRLTGREDAP